jgi:hypothetical protein
MERGMRIVNFLHKRIISAVNRKKFVSERMSYIILPHVEANIDSPDW